MPPATRGIKNPTPGAKNGKSVPVKPPPAKKANVAAAKKAPPSAPTKTPPVPPTVLDVELEPVLLPLHLITPRMFNLYQVELALGNFTRHGDSKEYAGATRHSAVHDRRRKKFEKEFIESATVDQKHMIVEWLTTMVTSPQGTSVPNLFKGREVISQKAAGGKNGFLLDFA